MAGESNTDINICSTALLLVEADEINSFSDDSREARVCAAALDTQIEALLQSYPWRFSLLQATLSLTTETPLFGYEYAHQLPSETLRLMSTTVPNGDYQVYKRRVFSNTRDVKAVIQYRPDSAEFPAYFRKALEYHLAAFLAFALKSDLPLADRMEAKALSETIKARAVDAQQQPNDQVQEYNFLLSNVRNL